MKKRNLIVVVASSLMIFAFLALPVISVKSFGFSVTMFKMMTGNNSLWSSLMFLLMLLAPIYLILDNYREKIPFMSKMVISSKIASILPLVFIIMLTFDIVNGKGISPTIDVGYYLYLLASVFVAVLPYVKHPKLDDK